MADNLKKFFRLAEEIDNKKRNEKRRYKLQYLSYTSGT